MNWKDKYEREVARGERLKAIRAAYERAARASGAKRQHLLRIADAMRDGEKKSS